MRIGVVIQARLSSHRLPGKVLRSLCGRPLLSALIERLRHAPGHPEIVVATSDESADDPLVGYCEAHPIPCYRGSLPNVAGRCLEAAESRAFDAFFRVCADSPLLDVSLFEQATAMAESAGDWDLITNVHPRTFPPGQSVELIRTETLRHSLRDFDSVEHFEHVTRFFYENDQRFAIHNFSAIRDDRDLRFTVDTPADLIRIEQLAATFARPQWTYSLSELCDRMRLLTALELDASLAGAES
jgi:spore coat polysaccharide biosynthesis protein SpsF